MKALTFKRYGKSPEIGFSDIPRPALKADEMLVQVHAAGVKARSKRSDSSASRSRNGLVSRS